MTVSIPRATATAAAVAALVAGTVAGTVAVGTQQADARPAGTPVTVCMTHHRFFEGLSPVQRRHTYRGGHLKWGVSGVECAGRWAAAAVQESDNGKPGYVYTGFEHLSARGNWYSLDRSTPCETHEVPRSLYQYACNSN